MNNTCKEKSPEVHPPDPRALVAQLDRVLDYESRGRGFESSPARHLFLFQSLWLKRLPIREAAIFVF